MINMNTQNNIKKIFLFNLVYSTWDTKNGTLYNDNGVAEVSFNIDEYPILKGEDIDFIVNYFKAHPIKFTTKEGVSLDNFNLCYVYC